MKKILFLFAFAIGMMAFAGEPVKTETTQEEKEESPSICCTLYTTDCYGDEVSVTSCVEDTHDKNCERATIKCILVTLAVCK